MRLSLYYLPTTKNDSADAVVVSHKLMLRAGMVRQTTTGIYTLLPFGYRVFEKVCKVIKEECNKFGCMEVLMPAIQPASLWQKSGRYDSYGKEMLRMKDRHDKDILFGPTNEEVITDLLTKDSISYRSLPINLYQIQWKFRDEIRPRYGVMRGREFCMFDAYSFDVDAFSARKTYEMYYQIYLNIFNRLGLNVIPVRANTGAIGGNLSHEFHILAESGESDVFYDKKLLGFLQSGCGFTLDEVERFYARADEEHSPDECDQGYLESKKGIEVGHIFFFDTKYSKSMDLRINNADGKPFFPAMGSYGIGVTRLIAAIIEANNDDKGIIWTNASTPFDIMLLNLDAQSEDEQCKKVCDEIYAISSVSKEVLYDDTKLSFGEKKSLADLLGIPYQVSVGKKLLPSGECEVKCRRSGVRSVIKIDKLKEVLGSLNCFSILFPDTLNK